MNSRRGMALLSVLVVCLLITIVLNALALGGSRVAWRQRFQMRREAALREARGGIRWGAAMASSPLLRRDDRGELRVTVKENAIESVYVSSPLDGVKARVTAKVKRKDDGSVILVDWMEE